MAAWLQAWGNEGGICSKGVSMDGKLGSGDECMVAYIMAAWIQVRGIEMSRVLMDARV